MEKFRKFNEFIFESELRIVKWVKDYDYKSIPITFVNINSLNTNPNEQWSTEYTNNQGIQHVNNLIKAIHATNKITAITVKNNNIIDGRHRYEALKLLGITNVGIQIVK